MHKLYSSRQAGTLAEVQLEEAEGFSLQLVFSMQWDEIGCSFLKARDVIRREESRVADGTLFASVFHTRNRVKVNPPHPPFVCLLRLLYYIHIGLTQRILAESAVWQHDCAAVWVDQWSRESWL